MLHGTKTSSETIFNASDSKKLWDFVHTLPPITPDIASNFRVPTLSMKNSQSASPTQTVYIDSVEFPNATLSDEIQSAIRNLPNYVRQTRL